MDFARSSGGGLLDKKPYNEMYLEQVAARSHYLRYAEWLGSQPADRLAQKRAEADALFHRVGITFAVYGQEEGAERLIPFDIVPRVLPLEEWIRLEGGLKQRVRALNAFIHDIYHDQQILKAGIIPAEQVLCNSQYRPEMQGVDVPGGIYAHIAGIDIVRDDSGRVLRAGGQFARALRRLVHARKSQDDDATCSRSCSPSTGSHRSIIIRTDCSTICAAWRRSEFADPTVVLLDRRRPQQRLFRTRLSGATDGYRAGRGPGFIRARRGGLHAHHAGSAARRCDLSAHRRRLFGPSRVPARFDARACRDC